MSAGTEARARAFDELIDIGGGVALRLRCEGVGVPPVVFESGLGMAGEFWYIGRPPVAPRVAELTRVCAYDRAGRGRSGPVRPPHSNAMMAEELEKLLRLAGERGPFVLVGHSMGGTNVRLFHSRSPESVAGMVLIDASPEPPPFDRFPPEALAEFDRNILLWEGLDRPTMLAGFAELASSTATLGDKPLVVLVAGQPAPEPGGPELARKLLIARQRAQEPLATLSRNSVLVTVVESGHDIPHQAPASVIAAVRAVVESARTGARLPESL